MQRKARNAGNATRLVAAVVRCQACISIVTPLFVWQPKAHLAGHVKIDTSRVLPKKGGARVRAVALEGVLGRRRIARYWRGLRLCARKVAEAFTFSGSSSCDIQ